MMLNSFYSLLMITEVTLFFDETRQELAVGFTLTIMLVMYTLYQSINDSMTKTAYLKMIDCWLLFCLMAPFTIFMIQIFWILIPKQDSKEVGPSGARNVQKNNKLPTTLSVRMMVHLLVLLASVVFIVGYFIAAFIISSK